jgi:hypothetical protein
LTVAVLGAASRDRLRIPRPLASAPIAPGCVHRSWPSGRLPRKSSSLVLGYRLACRKASWQDNIKWPGSPCFQRVPPLIEWSLNIQGDEILCCFRVDTNVYQHTLEPELVIPPIGELPVSGITNTSQRKGNSLEHFPSGHMRIRPGRYESQKFCVLSLPASAWLERGNR